MYNVVETIQEIVDARFKDKYIGNGITPYVCFIDEIRRNTALICSGNPHADTPTYMLVALLYKCFEYQNVEGDRLFRAFSEAEMYHHLHTAIGNYIKIRGKPYTLFSVEGECNKIIEYVKVLSKDDKSHMEYMELIKNSNHVVRTVKL